MKRYNSIMSSNNEGAGRKSLPDGHSEPEQTDKKSRPREIGGRKDGLDPTRYGDWEKNGRCIDF